MKQGKSILFASALMVVMLSALTISAGPPSSSATYVGASTCKMCHSGVYDQWSNTTHAKTLVPALKNTLFLNDADKNGVNDFEDGLILDGTHTYDTAFKVIADIGLPITLGTKSTVPGAFAPTISIGDNVFDVDFSFGLAYRQSYYTKFDNGFYSLPFRFNNGTGKYEASLTAWFLQDADKNYTGLRYTEGKTPLTEDRTDDAYQAECIICHSSGLSSHVKKENGEWTGQIGVDLSDYNVACEACHGPGSEHANGAFGNEDKRIVNPEDLDGQELQVSVCGRCHNSGIENWDEENNKPIYPGDNIFDHGELSISGYPDGTGNGAHHRQTNNFVNSTHYNNTNMSCFTCHTSHSDAGFEKNLKKNIDDNTLCLDCHANLGMDSEEKIVAHTHHEYNPEDGPSRCTDCHQPGTSTRGVAYDHHAHEFETLLPEKTLKFNMPNSCMASCHKTAVINGVTYTNEKIDDWNTEADIAIATYLDKAAKGWWGSNLPRASISTEKMAYARGETVVLNIAAANPNHRYVITQVLVVMLSPKGELFFFPSWGTDWDSINATLPSGFDLPSTRLFPVFPSSGPGTYYVGVAIVSPDSTLDKLTLYSDFSFDSGAISSFTVQ
jgi:hypothetical protein